MIKEKKWDQRAETFFVANFTIFMSLFKELRLFSVWKRKCCSLMYKSKNSHEMKTVLTLEREKTLSKAEKYSRSSFNKSVKRCALL